MGDSVLVLMFLHLLHYLIQHTHTHAHAHAIPGTTTSDRECDGCELGTFSTVFNSPSCTDGSDCDPGIYIYSIASLNRDTDCRECATNEFSNETNQNQCTLFQVCGDGFYQTSPGSSTTDRVCSLCRKGFAGTNGQCRLCSPTVGKYAADLGEFF